MCLAIAMFARVRALVASDESCLKVFCCVGFEVDCRLVCCFKKVEYERPLLTLLRSFDGNPSSKFGPSVIAFLVTCILLSVPIICCVIAALRVFFVYMSAEYLPVSLTSNCFQVSFCITLANTLRPRDDGESWKSIVYYTSRSLYFFHSC